MKYYSRAAFLASTICLAAGASEFSSALSAVESSVSGLKTKVDAWSSSKGLTGALGIQSDVQPLLDNVNSLKTAAQSVSVADITPAEIQPLAAAIVSLLQSIQSKESEFSHVGAKDIVANDVREIESPTIDIVSSLLSVVQQDCAKLSTLSPLVSQISTAFSSAGHAYGSTPKQFPNVPACQKRASEPNQQAQYAQGAQGEAANAPKASVSVPSIPLSSLSIPAEPSIVPHFTQPAFVPSSAVSLVSAPVTHSELSGAPASTLAPPEVLSSRPVPLLPLPKLSGFVSSVEPSSSADKGTVTVFKCPPSSVTALNEAVAPSDIIMPAIAVANITTESASRPSRPSAHSSRVNPVIVSVNDLSKNGTRLIPMLSNGATSNQIGFLAGLAAAAALLL